MTIISVYAYNAKGDGLFLGEASWDAPDCVYVTTPGDALALMGKARSAMRYDDDNGVWVRNRIASFRLDYTMGQSEDCPRSASFDAKCREVLARQGGATVYTDYSEAKAAETVAREAELLAKAPEEYRQLVNACVIYRTPDGSGRVQGSVSRVVVQFSGYMLEVHRHDDAGTVDLIVEGDVIDIIVCPMCGRDLKREGYPISHQHNETGDECTFHWGH